MLRKHVARFGVQFYQGFCRHEYHTTQEKPIFPLFGVDSSSPLEATLLPSNPLNQQVSHYHEELILSLSSPKGLAEKNSSKTLQGTE